MTHHLHEAHIWDRGGYIMRPGDSLSLVLIWPLLQFWREILCRVFVLPPEWTPCWLTSEYKHTGCFIITGRETYKTIKDIVNR